MCLAWEIEKYIRKFCRQMRREEQFGRSRLAWKINNKINLKEHDRKPGLDSFDSG
jgi:hypothetical protein